MKRLKTFVTWLLISIPSLIIIFILINIDKNSTNIERQEIIKQPQPPYAQPQPQKETPTIKIKSSIGLQRDELENTVYLYDKNLNSLMQNTNFWIPNRYVIAPYIKADQKNVKKNGIMKTTFRLFIYEHNVNDYIYLFDNIVFNIDGEIYEYELKNLYPADTFRYARAETSSNGKYIDFPNHEDIFYKIINSNKTTFRLKGYSTYDKELTQDEISALKNIIEQYVLLLKQFQ